MENRIPLIKTEMHEIICPSCSRKIRIAQRVLSDNPVEYHVYEQLLFKKFENRENLYLRDTREKIVREYPYYNEYIRIIYFNSLLNHYVMTVPETNQPKEVTNEYIFDLIRGKYRNEGLELVDIYGHIKK